MVSNYIPQQLSRLSSPPLALNRQHKPSRTAAVSMFAKVNPLPRSKCKSTIADWDLKLASEKG